MDCKNTSETIQAPKVIYKDMCYTIVCDTHKRGNILNVHLWGNGCINQGILKFLFILCKQKLDLYWPEDISLIWGKARFRKMYRVLWAYLKNKNLMSLNLLLWIQKKVGKNSHQAANIGEVFILFILVCFHLLVLLLQSKKRKEKPNMVAKRIYQ